jgi:aminodeoxyfutalosine deaminase
MKLCGSNIKKTREIAAMDNTSLTQFIHDLPKAELHVHLEGAIEPQTVLELARRNKMLDTLPTQQVSGLQQWFNFSDFPHFLQVYLTIQDLLRTPDDFALIAYELGADVAAQNILYREATFTPYTHTDYQDKGLSIEDILAGLEEGRHRAQKEFGVEMRWVFDVPRNLCFWDDDGRYNPLPAEKTLEYALLGRDRGVVALGLGGSEVGAPSEPFAHAFRAARQEGLWCVPHAGETMGAESVWGAIDHLGAQRIGHGVRSINDPALVQALVERGIPLEICPTSNIRLHVYADYATHPFRQLDDAGVIVTVNSDDPPLFNTTLSQEYHVLAERFGYDRAGLVRIARNAFVHAAVEDEVKQRLLGHFEEAVKPLA